MSENTKFLLSLCVTLGILGYLGYLSRREPLAQLTLPDDRTVFIYAEAEFRYDPPGYISCEIFEMGEVIVPERWFMQIGSERKPRGKFDVACSADQQLMAITLNGNVEFLHDFTTGASWPGFYVAIDEGDYKFATKVLARFREEGMELPCKRLREYEILRDAPRVGPQQVPLLAPK